MMEASFLIPLMAGWASGWVVNYLADVLPRTRRFSQPICIHCGSNKTWLDYILLLNCKSCGKRITFRVVVIHFLLVAMSVYIWLSPPLNLGYILGMIVLMYFSMDFVIDLEHRLILHPTSIFGAILGLGTGILRQGLIQTLLGGLAGFGIMFFFYLIGVLFTRIRAKRMRSSGLTVDDEEALGAGDVILSTILGLFLGWPLIWFGLLLGILLGGAISILLVFGLLATRKYKENALMVFIPYGPYILTSAGLLLYFPTWIKVIVPK